MKTDVIYRSAKFSECGKYRYVLTRQWDETLPFAMCIGLNPSTANAEDDDATISNLIRILRYAGYGGFYMTNLFALISTDPNKLRECPDPVKDNAKWLARIANFADDIIFCWGNFKQAEYMAKKIAPVFPDALCFGKNANGTPRHPLYLREDIGTMRFDRSRNIYQ